MSIKIWLTISATVFLSCKTPSYQDDSNLGSTQNEPSEPDFSVFNKFHKTLSLKEVEYAIENYLDKGVAIEQAFKIDPDNCTLTVLHERKPIFVLNLLTRDDHRPSLYPVLPPDHEHIYPPHLVFKDVKVIIDPGHVGGEWQCVERRCVRFVDSDIAFSEGELTWTTALVLKEMFEQQLKVQVNLTRNALGKSAIEDYPDWLKDNFDRARDLLVEKKSVRRSTATSLLSEEFVPRTDREYSYQASGSKLSSYAAHSFVYNSLYLKDDLRARSSLINLSGADVAFVIHYNAVGVTREGRFTKTQVDTNIHTAFVPGAFLRHELTDLEAKFNFLRMIVDAQTVYRSSFLCNYILAELAKRTNVPIRNGIELPNSMAATIRIPKNIGVYHRNILMTRTIDIPMCYVEAFIQNNFQEAQRLYASLNEYRNLEEGGKISQDNRIQQVARSIFSGYFNYFFDETLPWAFQHKPEF